jgi:hypothetical protein
MTATLVKNSSYPAHVSRTIMIHRVFKFPLIAVDQRGTLAPRHGQ